MSERLEEQLNKEVVSLRKSRKVLAIAGCIFLVFVVCYLSWIYRSVRTLTDTETLAGMIRHRAELQLPVVKDNIVSGIKSSAAQVADELIKEVRSRIPLLRKGLEEKVEYTINNLIIGYENRLQGILSEVLAPGSGEMYLDIINSLEDKEVARRLCQDLFEGIMTDLDGNLKKEIDLSLEEVLDISTETLEKIYLRLNILSSKEQLSESEALEKEFIMVLMEFFRKSFIIPGVD